MRGCRQFSACPPEDSINSARSTLVKTLKSSKLTLISFRNQFIEKFLMFFLRGGDRRLKEPFRCKFHLFEAASLGCKRRSKFSLKRKE